MASICMLDFASFLAVCRRGGCCLAPRQQPVWIDRNTHKRFGSKKKRVQQLDVGVREPGRPCPFWDRVKEKRGPAVQQRSDYWAGDMVSAWLPNFRFHVHARVHERCGCCGQQLCYIFEEKQGWHLQSTIYSNLEDWLYDYSSKRCCYILLYIWVIMLTMFVWLCWCFVSLCYI